MNEGCCGPADPLPGGVVLRVPGAAPAAKFSAARVAGMAMVEIDRLQAEVESLKSRIAFGAVCVQPAPTEELLKARREAYDAAAEARGLRAELAGARDAVASLRTLACWREDDATPLDRDFLVAAGGVADSPHIAFRRGDHTLFVAPPTAAIDARSLYRDGEGDTVYVPTPHTRGDFRRLLAALKPREAAG